MSRLTGCNQLFSSHCPKRRQNDRQRRDSSNHSNSSVGSDLTVASLDPDMMTVSSYWRHRTEPVWPCNTWTHSRLPRSHIFTITHSNHLPPFICYARQLLRKDSSLKKTAALRRKYRVTLKAATMPTSACIIIDSSLRQRNKNAENEKRTDLQ